MTNLQILLYVIGGLSIVVLVWSVVDVRRFRSLPLEESPNTLLTHIASLCMERTR